MPPYTRVLCQLFTIEHVPLTKHTRHNLSPALSPSPRRPMPRADPVRRLAALAAARDRAAGAGRRLSAAAFAPLLLTLPLAWAAHARASLALHGVALGLFLALYGLRLLPPPLKVRPVQASETAVTLLTHNLRYMYHDPDELIAAMLAQDADLLALQEVAPSAERAVDRGAIVALPLLCQRRLGFGCGALCALSHRGR